MADKHIVVAAHGHCFDGLVSAAMFTHLRNGLDRRSKRYSYRSCGYGPNMRTVPDRWLKGDENAIVDFRFAASERLTWYFDHHITAFASDAQREAALENDRYYYEPTYGSCTKLIVDIGHQRYGAKFDRYNELVDWADKIDSASFASADDAIDRSHPVMQLSAVVEQHGNGSVLSTLVPRILDEPIADVGQSEEVQKLWKPIAEAQQETRSRIGNALERRGDVVLVDLHAKSLRASGKFVAYALAPACVYSVALIRMRQHFKVSIGYNPWCGQARRHDVAALCQRHGGGGHPVVGAFSVPLDQLATARRLASEVVDELNS